MCKKIAIIFAGGVGQRFGMQIPKQFVNIYGNSIIVHTLNAFQNHDEIDEIYVGCIEEWIPYLKQLIKFNNITKVLPENIIAGGTTGQDTIYRILKKVKETCSDDDIVLIHDGVRPLVTKDEISNNINSVKKYGNAITCIPFTETPIYSEDGKILQQTLDRNKIYRGVAPQSFRLGRILEAHEKIRKNDIEYSDEYNGSRIVDSASLLKAAFNDECHIVIGNQNNIKVTTTGDYFSLLGLLATSDIENYFYGKVDNEIKLNSAMLEAANIEKKKSLRKQDGGSNNDHK